MSLSENIFAIDSDMPFQLILMAELICDLIYNSPRTAHPETPRSYTRIELGPYHNMNQPIYIYINEPERS